MLAAACFAAVAGVVWPEARAVRRSWRGDGIGGFYFTGVIEVERDFIMRSTYERTGFDGAGGFEVERETSDQWRGFLGETSRGACVACDIAGSKTVAEMMHHIVAVELRYAERIARVAETRLSR